MIFFVGYMFWFDDVLLIVGSVGDCDVVFNYCWVIDCYFIVLVVCYGGWLVIFDVVLVDLVFVGFVEVL